MSDVVTWHPGVVLTAIDLTPAIIAAIQDALSTEQVIALTAWGEARSRLEPGRGWIANPPAALLDIMNVIENRSKDRRWSAGGRKGVCLAHRQFSCWDSLDGPDNFHALLDEAQQLLAGHLPTPPLLTALAMAHTCTAGALVDELRGATHYFATSMATPPPWAAPPAVVTAERFGHRYFANVR